ncbi:MAG: S8 family serine peptidase [Alphaproteobacteria bacterium]|nr:S8 family serine peptidase [Alphaproteobacteria bacterium]
MISLRIAVLAALFLAQIVAPATVEAQSNTRILKYNDKGEVTGVIEEKGKSRKREDPDRKSGSAPAKSEDRTVNIPEEELVEPGEVVVINPPANFIRTIRGEGYTVIERLNLETLGLAIVRLRTPSDMNAIEGVRAIKARYPAVTVDVNQRFNPNRGPQGDYGRAVIGWGEVPASCGDGVRLGMIDTMVDIAHPAIQGQRVARRSFIPKGKKPGVSDHGTAVAALLIGKTDDGDWKGLLPGASLYAANIFSARADGGLRANLASMMKALEWLAEKKVDVINFSLAGSANKVLTKLMERASARGLALVAAAGNGGAKARPAYPAAHPMVLAVTAVDKSLAPYGHANHGDYIDFAAPGVRLWTARTGGGGLQSGTSFAAPYITAAVALNLANGVKADSRTLRKTLRRFTKDLGPPGRDAIFGWGLVRIRPNC